MKKKNKILTAILIGNLLCHIVNATPEQDFQKYKTQAYQGDAYGQCNLGLCYEYGTGVGKDEAAAVKWYRKAADQGLAYAQWCLGCCYGNGTGVVEDQAAAVEWVRKAADQGQALAQAGLGYDYFTGRGVPKDYVEAYKWINLSAAQGDRAAAANLSNIEKSLTPNQIAEAQRMAREFKPNTTAAPASNGMGLVQPTYGSPKYDVSIWNPGHHQGGTMLDRSPYELPEVPPFIWWTVEVGEVYIVDGYVTNKTQLGIRMGPVRVVVPTESISLVQPDDSDYAKAEKLYADCCKKEEEHRIESLKRMDAQQREAAENIYRQMLLNQQSQPINVFVH